MAAEKRSSSSHRATDVAGGHDDKEKDKSHLSIEERYDEVRQLISIGKEKGYLLYDEVNEMLPSEITSSDELDDLFNTFGSAGIEVIDSDQKYLRDDVKPIDRTAEGAEEMELDLTPGALDKTNDPVRMYLREMGTVPISRKYIRTGSLVLSSAPGVRSSSSSSAPSAVRSIGLTSSRRYFWSESMTSMPALPNVLKRSSSSSEEVISDGSSSFTSS